MVPPGAEGARSVPSHCGLSFFMQVEFVDKLDVRRRSMVTRDKVKWHQFRLELKGKTLVAAKTVRANQDLISGVSTGGFLQIESNSLSSTTTNVHEGKTQQLVLRWTVSPTN
eukprot:1153754-Pelagomonas_calceolata.AAC.2